jgi:hypothetical protein
MPFGGEFRYSGEILAFIMLIYPAVRRMGWRVDEEMKQ